MDLIDYLMNESTKINNVINYRSKRGYRIGKHFKQKICFVFIRRNKKTGKMNANKSFCIIKTY